MFRLIWPHLLYMAVILSPGGVGQETSRLGTRDIESKVVRMLHAVDALDWYQVRSAFTHQVRVDYTSLFGGPVENLPIDSLVSRWEDLLPGFDATQHLIGPVVVVRHDGHTATAETQVRAYHYVAGADGGAVWLVSGRYEFGLEARENGWRITAITLHFAYQEGNLGLPAIAARGVAEQRTVP